MPSTKKAIRMRLKGLRSSRKITSAMKWVAAARWHRGVPAYQHLADYVRLFEETVVVPVMSYGYEDDDALSYMRTQTEGRQSLLIVCTPHRGLCGGYQQIVKQAALSADGHGPFHRCIVTTEKGLSLLGGVAACAPEYLDLASTEQQIRIGLEAGYRITLVEGYSCNSFVQKARVVPLWPYVATSEHSVHASRWPFEMGSSVDDSLLPHVLWHATTMRWRLAHMSSSIAEEVARMSAMDQATRNADEAIDAAQSQYNRLRQERITTELIELVGGSID